LRGTLIVSHKRSRPRRYDRTINLFAEAGQRRIVQVAAQKQPIANLISAGLGTVQWSASDSRFRFEHRIFRETILHGPLTWCHDNSDRLLQGK